MEDEELDRFQCRCQGQSINLKKYLKKINLKIKVNILLDENADDEKEKKQKNKEPEWMINSTVTNDDPYRFLF